VIGYDSVDVLGDQVRELLHPDGMLLLRDRWQQVLDAGDGQWTRHIRHQDSAAPVDRGCTAAGAGCCVGTWWLDVCGTA